MIKEDYVSFKTAIKLKEKGFPQLVSLFKDAYSIDGNKIDSLDAIVNNGYTRPSLYIVQKWLREEKDLYINVESYPTHGKYTIIYNAGIVIHSMLHYATYEEALKAAINKALELI